MPDSPGRTCRSGRWWLGRPQCRESGIVDPPTWRSSQSLSSFPISFHQTPVAPAGVPHDVYAPISGVWAVGLSTLRGGGERTSPLFAAGGAGAMVDGADRMERGGGTARLSAVGLRASGQRWEVVPVFVEFEVAVPHLRPAGW